MQIPTEKVIEQLRKVVTPEAVRLTNVFAIKVIEEQAQEILELQAVIVRLRIEYHHLYLQTIEGGAE